MTLDKINDHIYGEQTFCQITYIFYVTAVMQFEIDCNWLQGKKIVINGRNIMRNST